MSQPGPTLWVRALAVALLGVMAMSAAARPARATGCHAAERPVLGLTPAGDSDPAASASPERSARSVARFTRTPCSGETPSLAGRDVPPAAVAMVEVVLQVPARRAGHSAPVRERLSATDLPSGLDRPPRPSPVARSR